MRETKTINILIFLSVFVSSITFFKTPFEGYFHYLIFLALFPSFIAAYGFPKQVVIFLLLPLIVGILEILVGNDTWALFLKIFLGLLLSVSFYYYVIQYFKLDIKKIFELYLKGSFIICCIGLVQFVSYKIHFAPGYNYHWLLNKWSVVPGGFGVRVNSIFSEASQFAIVIAPACFVAIHNLLPGTNSYGLKRIQSIVIFVTFLLSASSTGYIGLFVILVLFVINYGQIIYLFVVMTIALVGANLLYNNIPEFKSRVDSSIGLWISGEFTLENINSSSFILYNNFHIASENFKSNFLVGTGLGSHEVAFDKYTLTNEGAQFLNFTFNKADGNSMFIRLMSETGLMGIIFIIVFIGKNFVGRDKYDNENPEWIISNAILVIIILYLLRQGNYFLNGLPLFMWMYYYLRKGKEQRIFNELNGIITEDDVDGEEEEHAETEKKMSVANSPWESEEEGDDSDENDDDEKDDEKDDESEATKSPL